MDTSVATPSSTATGPRVFVSNTDGVHEQRGLEALPQLLEAGKVFWLDLVGELSKDALEMLRRIGLDDADLTWLTRFRQSGRMTLTRQKFRVVTWIADGPKKLIEIHVLCVGHCLLTLWNDKPELLRGIREHFAERAARLEKSPYQATAILLQLLLGTVHAAIDEFDEELSALTRHVQSASVSIDLPGVAAQMQTLQTTWSGVERYSSAVRTALVGVEVLPGMDAASADELNDYADQVEDVEQRLNDRLRWASQMMQEYASTLAQRQGEQIDRLTIVSIIFLPITFLTGFFGMNFNVLTEAMTGRASFLLLGVALPVACAIASIVWFRRRGLM
jgi:Mg2+ and Co2+ transporter CorA